MILTQLGLIDEIRHLATELGDMAERLNVPSDIKVLRIAARLEVYCNSLERFAKRVQQQDEDVAGQMYFNEVDTTVSAAAENL